MAKKPRLTKKQRIAAGLKASEETVKQSAAIVQRWKIEDAQIAAAATDKIETVEPETMYQWRDAFLSEHGPEKSMTRMMLLAFMRYMTSYKLSCHPSVRFIAKEFKLSKQFIETHTSLAQQSGWLKIEKGKGKHNTYQATIPKKLINHLTKEYIKKNRKPDKKIKQIPVHDMHLAYRILCDKGQKAFFKYVGECHWPKEEIHLVLSKWERESVL